MNTKKRILVSALLVVLALAVAVTPALADLGLVKRSTKAKGATTITWDSSFADFVYTVGDDISMTVTWDVNAGAASYNGFALKRYTPRSKKDPATGTTPVVTAQSGNSVTVKFKFTDLHLDKKRNVEIGNGHFKLYLMIDRDGDGVVESQVGYGVNVHVEDPQ